MLKMNQIDSVVRFLGCLRLRCYILEKDVLTSNEDAHKPVDREGIVGVNLSSRKKTFFF